MAHDLADEAAEGLLKEDPPQRPAFLERLRSRKALWLGLLGTSALLLASRFARSRSSLTDDASGASLGLPMGNRDPLLGMKRLAELVGEELPKEVEEDLMDARMKRLARPDASKRSLRDIVRAIRIYRARYSEEQRELKIAYCVNAVYDMAVFIGYAGLAIDALTIDGLCPEDSINCGATALTVADELIWAMSQAAQIPGWCLPADVQVDPQIACLTTMSTFFATILQIAEDGMFQKSACDLGPKLEDFVPEVAEFKAKVNRRILELKSRPFPTSPRPPATHRNGSSVLPPPEWEGLQARLLQDIALLGPDDTRRNELGVCSLAIMQTVNDFPYAGVDVWAATMDCKKAAKVEKLAEKYDVFKKGSYRISTEEACAADALGLIGSFVNLATDVAVILSVCPGPKSSARKQATPCVAGSTDIISLGFGLGGWATTADQSCNDGMFDQKQNTNLSKKLARVEARIPKLDAIISQDR